MGGFDTETIAGSSNTSPESASFGASQTTKSLISLALKMMYS